MLSAKVQLELESILVESEKANPIEWCSRPNKIIPVAVAFLWLVSWTGRIELIVLEVK